MNYKLGTRVCLLTIVFALGGCAASETRQSSSHVDPLFAMAQAASQPAGLTSRVYNWDELKVDTTAVGERRQLVRSPTGTLSELEMHITTLNPGQQAHAPHRHANEELILLKEGTMEAMINDKMIPMPTGSILYVSPNDLHVVKNVGTTKATYFVVTWRTPRTGAGAQ